MALIIGTILALLSLGVAVYPFARRRLGMDKAARAAAAGGMAGAETETETAAGPDTASLADIYAAIRTLQLERELGRIPEGLYQEQLNDYRLQAALALRRQEQEQQSAAAPAGRDADAALEAEIQAARAGLRRAANDAGDAAGPVERE